MTDPVIRAEGLSKLYRIGAAAPRYKTLREALASLVTSRLGRQAAGAGEAGSAGENTIWALQDVSFKVEQGEVIGIIGRNAAGKSTLLKILSRITEPTRGTAEIRGSVGSLLEVGTGFHPELTGRENIFLNGAVLGMKRAEIQRKLPEIAAFAEVEKFLDTPAKHYSSGMYMRLAFSVAAHLEPAILIVDEVLAVGDAEFQKRCLGKMGQVARQGRTVLLVSHNMVAVQGLCGRALWLEKGRIVESGSAQSVVANYLKTTVQSISERTWEDPDRAPGSQEIRLAGARVVPPAGSTPRELTISTPFELEITYWNLQPGLKLNLSLAVINQEGVFVFTSTTEGEKNWHGKGFPAGLFQSRCRVPSNLLNEGSYSVLLLFVKNSMEILHREDALLALEIHDDVRERGAWYGKWLGVVRPSLDWQTDLLETAGVPGPLQSGVVR